MRFETVIKFEIRNPKHEWFDKPFDRLTVLSKVEGHKAQGTRHRAQGARHKDVICYKL